MKIQTILRASILLLVSVQASAELIYGLGGASSDLMTLDVSTGVSTSLFPSFFHNTSGLAFASPNPIPIPAAVWLFGTALIGFVGMSRRRAVA